MQHASEENLNLSSLEEAQQFLNQFDWYRHRLETSISVLYEPLFDGDMLTPDRIRSEVVKHWSDIMSMLPLSQQQDRVFQNALTAALENVILYQVHDRVCQELHAKYKDEDHHIWNHCQLLTKKNISAEKLGVPDGYALSFPAALVELAALDIQKCPLDKLRCLRSVLDFIDAEIKRAIADTHIMASEEVTIPPITSGDMVPLLSAVLIQAKPLHLATNLEYVKSFQQTLSPCDPLCTSLETFQSALCHVMSISAEDDDEEIRPIRLGRGMSKEIELEELAQLSCYMDKKQQREVTPLECQLHHMAGNIEKAMDNDRIRY